MLSFLAGSCRKEVSRQEAESMLKAMDSEIIKMARQIQRTPTYEAMERLVHNTNIPIPYFAHHSVSEGGARVFSFDQAKGVYRIDSEGVLNRISNSDSLIIRFYDSSFDKEEIEFVIAEYLEEPSSSSLMFPTQIKAWLEVSGMRVMNLEHQARLDHQLPVEARTRIQMESYQFDANLITKLHRRYGNLSLIMTVSKDGVIVSELLKKARLGLVEPGAFYFKRLHMAYSIFPVKIDIKVRNDRISRDASAYIEEFNRHSRMLIYRQHGKGKLGEINLRTREGSDKLDYAFYFNDGSYLYIDEMLLSAKSIMSVKK
jgi:hypothetical protein